TGTESDAFGPLAEVHEFGTRHRRGDRGHVVVLRDPVTSETELVRFVDDLLRGGKGVCGRLSRANRHEVKDGKLHIEATAGVTGSFLTRPSRPQPKRVATQPKSVSTISRAMNRACSTGSLAGSIDAGGTQAGRPSASIRQYQSDLSIKWWCAEQANVRLLTSVLPPSAHGTMWCASHHPGGVSHPGKVQPWSRLARIANCFSVASRRSVARAIVFVFSLIRWKKTEPFSPSSAAVVMGKGASAPVVALPVCSARSSALAVTTRAYAAPALIRSISMLPTRLEKRS